MLGLGFTAGAHSRTDLITGRSIRELRKVDVTFVYRVSNIVSFERERSAHTPPP